MYPDLTPHLDFPPAIAVGWLTPLRAFPTGPTDKKVYGGPAGPGLLFVPGKR